MNSKRWPRWLQRATPVLLLPFLTTSHLSVAETYDFEFQAGQTEVATRKFQEIGKRGYNLGVLGLKYWGIPYGQLGLGLGALTTKVEGKKASRGITQDLSLNLLTIELRYLYTLQDGLDFGPFLRTNLGRGAKYSVQANDDVDVLLSPGVMIRYAFKNLDYSPTLSFAYSHDANIAKRDVQNYLIGVGIRTDFAGRSAEVASMTPPPSPSAPAEPASVPSTPAEPASVPSTPAAPSAPEAAVIPPPPEAPPTIVEIKPTPETAAPQEARPAVVMETLTFNFNPNSSRLNGISRERAKALAKVLTENASIWSKISVTGHSDKSGDPQLNIDLSKRRTEAFCDTLAKRGVPRKKMQCTPMDFQQLLPGLPENAENHRRIEVKFEEVDSTQAETLQQAIQKALQL